VNVYEFPSPRVRVDGLIVRVVGLTPVVEEPVVDELFPLLPQPVTRSAITEIRKPKIK
jgi:hypothetical protein